VWSDSGITNGDMILVMELDIDGLNVLWWADNGDFPVCESTTLPLSFIHSYVTYHNGFAQPIITLDTSP
jgi:hypothetical protein